MNRDIVRKSGERCEEGCESSGITLRNTPGAEWMREIKGLNMSRVSSLQWKQDIHLRDTCVPSEEISER